MSDTFTFTQEKFHALLVRLFTDGCKGRYDFYQRIIDDPNSIEKTLQTFLKSPKGSNSQIVVKSCDLLAILKDAFQEGIASYPETRESVVQRLIESLPEPTPKSVKSLSMERYEKEFQRLLFDKWATIEYTTNTTNSTPVYYYDNITSGQMTMSTNMNQWIINF